MFIFSILSPLLVEYDESIKVLQEQVNFFKVKRRQYQWIVLVACLAVFHNKTSIDIMWSFCFIVTVMTVPSQLGATQTAHTLALQAVAFWNYLATTDKKQQQ